jgi:hypothetical protein
MTRLLLAAAVLALASACGGAAAPSRPRAEDPLHAADPRGPNLEAARELDQQGVRAFREARYEDAVRDFRAARDLGGPPSELWNIARCAERVDDAERAVQVLDEYAAAPDLAPADRAEAEREKKLLAARPSTLTVTTTPPGAQVTIDGQRAARVTPFSLEIAGGSHTVDVRRAGYLPWTQAVDARFGRAVIVALYLARADK